MLIAFGRYVCEAWRAGRILEPPGFLALHYGWQTPLWVVLGHLVYGCVLGHFLNGR